VGAAGLQKPGDITAHHLMLRNADGQARSLASHIDTLTPGQLLGAATAHTPWPSPFAEYWAASQAQHWGAVSA
jgi:hypothetical protein